MWEINYDETAVFCDSPHKSAGKRIKNKANAVNEYLKLRKRVRFVGARNGNGGVENLEIDEISSEDIRIPYTQALEYFLCDTEKTEWTLIYQKSVFFNNGEKEKVKAVEKYGSKLKAVERYTDIINQLFELGNDIQVLCNGKDYTEEMNAFFGI